MFFLKKGHPLDTIPRKQLAITKYGGADLVSPNSTQLPWCIQHPPLTGSLVSANQGYPVQAAAMVRCADCARDGLERVQIHIHDRFLGNPKSGRSLKEIFLYDKTVAMSHKRSHACIEEYLEITRRARGETLLRCISSSIYNL